LNILETHAEKKPTRAQGAISSWGPFASRIKIAPHSSSAYVSMIGRELLISVAVIAMIDAAFNLPGSLGYLDEEMVSDCAVGMELA
jgi:hypothetical protein